MKNELEVQIVMLSARRSIKLFTAGIPWRNWSLPSIWFYFQTSIIFHSVLFMSLFMTSFFLRFLNRIRLRFFYPLLQFSSSLSFTKWLLTNTTLINPNRFCWLNKGPKAQTNSTAKPSAEDQKTEKRRTKKCKTNLRQNVG